jgi:hypothetical protein
MTQVEHRKSPRVTIAQEVVCLVGEGASRIGQLRNLSLGGTFIEGVDGSAKIVVNVRSPSTREWVGLAATVRWRSHDGVGVQFAPFGAKEVEVLTELIDAELRALEKLPELSAALPV